MAETLVACRGRGTKCRHTSFSVGGLHALFIVFLPRKSVRGLKDERKLSSADRVLACCKKTWLSLQKARIKQAHVGLWEMLPSVGASCVGFHRASSTAVGTEDRRELTCSKIASACIW